MIFRKNQKNQDMGRSPAPATSGRNSADHGTKYKDPPHSPRKSSGENLTEEK